MRLVLVLTTLMLATGCASLRLQPNDSTRQQVGKIAARVPLCAATACVSELHLACLAADEDHVAAAQCAATEVGTVAMIVALEALAHGDLGGFVRR